MTKYDKPVPFGLRRCKGQRLATLVSRVELPEAKESVHVLGFQLVLLVSSYFLIGPGQSLRMHLFCTKIVEYVC